MECGLYCGIFLALPYECNVVILLYDFRIRKLANSIRIPTSKIQNIQNNSPFFNLNILIVASFLVFCHHLQIMIDRKLVEHIAKLSRLQLKEDEVVKYQDQLSKILDYIDQLKKLEVKDVKPYTHPGEAHTILRPDQPAKSLEREDALKNAPEKVADFFSVPRVIEE